MNNHLVSSSVELTFLYFMCAVNTAKKAFFGEGTVLCLFVDGSQQGQIGKAQNKQYP